jgi:uncharacterized hydrophobic protein (TIGR00271 family)
MTHLNMINEFKDLFNLHIGEEDKDKTLRDVCQNISFTGANLWILACAIMVASVGLNVNSTAVIIGAMLISPLMGPIVGAGFALGTYDFDLLQQSLRSLLTATLVSLFVSTLYFFISPFKDVQSELLSRTTPTIYDVLIAFFGGIVGVIAITRVEKGNPIPGVAIATALMPPLCTAGYGLATGHLSYFFGAFYLYCINCVFICIATFVIVKYLNYPTKVQINEEKQKKIRNLISGLIILMLLPSSYLAYSFYKEQQFKKNSEDFIEHEFTNKGYTLVYQNLIYRSTPPKIELAFLSKRFDSTEIKQLREKMLMYRINSKTLLNFRQDSTDRYVNLKGDILNELKASTNVMNEKNIKIAELTHQIARNTFNNNQLTKEAQTVFNNIEFLSLSNHDFMIKQDSFQTIPIAIYVSKTPLSKDDNLRLINWLKQRLEISEVEIYRKSNL